MPRTPYLPPGTLREVLAYPSATSTFDAAAYDNALLVDLMCEAYRETGKELYALRIDETVGWLLREMIAEGGGFAASLDAVSAAYAAPPAR